MSTKLETKNRKTPEPYPLPKGWKWVELADICQKPQYGYTAPANPEEIGPKMLRITDIQNGMVNWESVPYCKISDSELGKYKLEQDDILFARTGATTGKSYLIKCCPLAVFASYLIRLKANKSQVLPEFIYFFFQSPQYWDQIIPRGGAQPHMNAKILSRVIVPIPDKKEQRRIVARIEQLFEKLDEVKRLKKQVLAQVKALLPSALHQVFSKADEKGWKWVRLGEIAETSMGGTPKTTMQEYWANGEIIWITPGDMEKGIINKVYDSNRKITIKGLENSNAKLFPINTVLLTTTATIGKVGISSTKVSSNQQITGIVCEEILSPPFLAYFLVYLGEHGLKKLGGEATATHINQKNLKKLKIPLPPLAEQKRIVAYLDKIQQKAQVLQKLQEETQKDITTLRETILHKAFRGEL
ncbi:restriction endonuclease subunit S [Candidatus Sumerlaeota bacterium]|nr:restriction endonuclease subunit S [Candidatus Sumerlaeota bacterium]